jgi:dienelactone hydrolase
LRETGRNKMRSLWIGLFLLAGCSAPFHETLSGGETGYFTFPTQQRWDGREINIGGTLDLPTAGSAPHPTVVIVHSANGITESERSWRSMWLEEGYAVFMLDYVAPRGVTSRARNLPRGGLDVADAMEVLQTHPALDPELMAVQGVSNGATVAVRALPITARRAGLSPPVAVLLSYGGCGASSQVNPPAQDTVIRFYVGADDTPIRPEACDRTATRWADTGMDAVAYLFPDTVHGFDENARRTVPTRFGVTEFAPNPVTTRVMQADARAALAKAFDR